jgi:hypothetical protein
MNKKNKRRSKLIRKYKTAIKTRNFEIELFWKRALFFWGFIAVSFVSYVKTTENYHSSEYIPLLIACFGFICSIAWSLVNRGSKYWQENWENIITKLEEKEEIGLLFSRVQTKSNTSKKPEKSKWIGFWLKKRKFSVSKLVMVISDVLIIVWFFLIFQHVEILQIFNDIFININVMIFILTLFFVVLIVVRATRSKNNKKFKKDELFK